MARETKGWGLFSQKFYDDWEAASTGGKILIILTILAGFLLIMLGAALSSGHILGTR